MRNGPYELVIAPADYPGMRYRGRYCYEHHLVWWQSTGALPGPDELIHHKNEKKRDNRFSNLEKKTKAVHASEHNLERAAPWIRCICAWCRKEFEVIGHTYRHRAKVSKSGKIFCSRSCGAKNQFSEVG